MIADKNIGQSYLVVTGETGVGKTCLLNTVTSKTAGVIKRKTSNILASDLHPPIVIINATEREIGQDYAGFTGAVRTLVDDFNLRVIVDSSPNSISDSLLRTKREDVIDIKPMTKEMIWQIEQLQDLFKYAKEAGLEDTLFAVLGGVPADYEKLWRPTKIALQAGRDAREVIGTHVCAVTATAIKTINDSCGNDDRATAKLMKLFHETSIFTKSTLVTNQLQRPTPDTVFCEVERDGVFVLIPASNAIGIVLRHNLTGEPSLTELEKLLKNKV